MTNIVLIIVIALSAAVVCGLLVFFFCHLSYGRQLATKDALLKSAETLREQVEKSAEQRLADACANYERSLAEMKAAQAKVLEAAKNELALENEKALKLREEELHKRNLEEMKGITGPLGEQIKTMQAALDAQKLSHTKETAAMSAKFEETVRNMQRQTETLGTRADNLTAALKGGSKMQGNWGERIIRDIFDQEGLMEGRDYDREEYLRDESGEILHNEDSGKRMRPDYILHFPDETDIILDAKMSIDAYVDWFNAGSDEEKVEAAKRNLTALKAQIKTLTGRSYQSYVKNGRKALDYVIMYVSNYGALQLAKTLEPNIVNEAFRSNVLITTEETLMPFLRMIHTAWVNVDQIRNQEKIVKQASLMCERVSDLCADVAAVRKHLEEAFKAQEKAERKLQEGGTSIVRAAREVVRLGVPQNPKKALPSDADTEN